LSRRRRPVSLHAAVIGRAEPAVGSASQKQQRPALALWSSIPDLQIANKDTVDFVLMLSPCRSHMSTSFMPTLTFQTKNGCNSNFGVQHPRRLRPLYSMSRDFSMCRIDFRRLCLGQGYTESDSMQVARWRGRWLPAVPINTGEDSYYARPDPKADQDGQVWRHQHADISFKGDHGLQ
jgi:hypothetical protein